MSRASGLIRRPFNSKNNIKSKSVKSTHFEISLDFITSGGAGGGVGGGAQAKYIHFQETITSFFSPFFFNTPVRIRVKNDVIVQLLKTD